MKNVEIAHASAVSKQVLARRQELMDSEHMAREEASRVVIAEIVYGRRDHWPLSAVVSKLQIVAEAGGRKNLDRSGGSLHRDVDLRSR